MNATPMLDKVRQYAKGWGIKIVGNAGQKAVVSRGQTIMMEPPREQRTWTHDGPGIFSIHWPSRQIVEPIATVQKRGRVATDSDRWCLVHEISHILVNVDPDDVDEIHSPMLAMDYYSGQYLGLSGWADWMDDFTLPEMEMVARPDEVGDIPLLRSCEWGDVDKTVQERLLGESLGHAIAKGLLTEDGTPTFNRAAWMPASMLVERAATRLLRAAILEAKH